MELTCIVCPMGCRMTAEKSGGEIKVSGNTCKRGEKYAVQEMTCPMRTLTSLVKVRGGEGPLCPVKTGEAIPKAMIGAALEEVRGACIDAPVRIGDVVIPNIAGTGVDLIATANRAKEA
jgi:CxxC motif-containing protein